MSHFNAVDQAQTVPKQSSTFNFVIGFGVFLSCCFSTVIYAATSDLPAQQKAVWYRYYDQKGVANLSSSVTPAHIQHGYEALDAHMQVIKKSQRYNADLDQRQSVVRAQRSQQLSQDQQLKRAYGSSKTASSKRDDLLKKYNQQIALQREQLRQSQKDRIVLKKQEIQYFQDVKPVPIDLKKRLEYNLDNIKQAQSAIHSLQTDYRKAQAQYDTIIKRLKTIE